MPNFLKLMTLTTFVAFSSAAIAQETETPKPEVEPTAEVTTQTPTTETPTDEALADDAGTQEDAATDETPDALSMGEEVVDENAPGTTYVVEQFDAWELRCVRVEEGQKEPCQLFQLMKDAEGTAIAEISMVVLKNSGQAASGATIVVPLETLLTKQLTLAVDAGAKKRYPFRFCSPVGCFAQVGFSNGDIASFKRGAAASLSISPAFAPKETISVELSLAGFTKAYDALKELSK